VLRGKVRARLIALLLPLAWPALAVAQTGAGGATAAAAHPQAARTAPRANAAPRVVEAVAALTDWVKGRGGSASVRISEADSGLTWAEHAPDAALNPASNMKVLTAAAALDRLGPEYRASTGLYGEVVAGRVETLVLRGEGDPSLSLADLWELGRA